MSDQPQDENGLLKFIAARVESVNERVEVMGSQMEAMHSQMATKEDIAYLETKLELEVAAVKSEVTTVRDQMATKIDLVHLESRLFNRIEAEATAIRGDIERVDLRLDTIERAISTRLSQIETEVSRLRSVLYLLVKDRPDLLRLLGQEPPVN